MVICHSGTLSICQNGEQLENVFLTLDIYTSHTQHIQLNGSQVILQFPGIAANLNTCWQIPPWITADSKGFQEQETLWSSFSQWTALTKGYYPKRTTSLTQQRKLNLGVTLNVQYNHNFCFTEIKWLLIFKHGNQHVIQIHVLNFDLYESCFIVFQKSSVHLYYSLSIFHCQHAI